MHFGHSVHFTRTGDVLRVICPIDTRWLLVMGLGLVFFILAGSFAARIAPKDQPVSPPGAARTPEPLLSSIVMWVFGIGILVVLPVFALAITTSNGEVVLNGATGTVDATRVTLFWPHRYHYPLSELEGADVSQSEASEALRLNFSGGSSLQLTTFNQQAGKGEAAAAINQFISDHKSGDRPWLRDGRGS